MRKVFVGSVAVLLHEEVVVRGDLVILKVSEELQPVDASNRAVEAVDSPDEIEDGDQLWVRVDGSGQQFGAARQVSAPSRGTDS